MVENLRRWGIYSDEIEYGERETPRVRAYERTKMGHILRRCGEMLGRVCHFLGTPSYFNNCIVVSLGRRSVEIGLLIEYWNLRDSTVCVLNVSTKPVELFFTHWRGESNSITIKLDQGKGNILAGERPRQKKYARFELKCTRISGDCLQIMGDTLRYWNLHLANEYMKSYETDRFLLVYRNL